MVDRIGPRIANRSFATGPFRPVTPIAQHHLGRESIGYAAITQPDDRVVVAGRASFGEEFGEAPSALEGARTLLMRFRR